MTHPTKSTRESSDNYGAEICRTETSEGFYRVIVCRNGIQWIIQRLTWATGGPHKAQWRAIRYLRTRNSLEQFWATFIGESLPIQIQSLPPRITRQDQTN